MFQCYSFFEEEAVKRDLIRDIARLKGADIDEKEYVLLTEVVQDLKWAFDSEVEVWLIQDFCFMLIIGRGKKSYGHPFQSAGIHLFLYGHIDPDGFVTFNFALRPRTVCGGGSR